MSLLAIANVLVFLQQHIVVVMWKIQTILVHIYNFDIHLNSISLDSAFCKENLLVS